MSSLPKLPNTIIMDIIKQAYKSGTLDYHRRHIPKEHMDKVHGTRIRQGIHNELLNQNVLIIDDDEYCGSDHYYSSEYFNEEDEDASYINYMSSFGTTGIHQLYNSDRAISIIEYNNALNKARETTIRVR